GCNAKSRKVFSRLNTRAIKIPSGLVIASTASRKNPICSHPFAVMALKVLGLEQRVQQIAQQQRADDDQNHITRAHRSPPGFSRSHPRTYRIAAAKKINVAPMNTMSSMDCLSWFSSH